MVPQMTSSDHDHTDIEQKVKSLVAFYRKKLLIPPRWQIDVVVSCPEFWGRSDGALPPNGSIVWEYLPNRNYRMRICCTLADDRLEYTVAHELLEALTADYADLVETLLAGERNKRLVETLDERHREIRDEIIEWMLAIIMPEKRPNVHPKF